MYRYLTVLLLSLVLFTSCGKEAPAPLTREQMQHQIDSVTAMRLLDAEYRAHRELEHRMKIEVKVKADSIGRAREQKNQAPPPTDTTHKQ